MKTILHVAIGSLALSPLLSAEELVENGSFESPTVDKRTPSNERGDPTRSDGATSWTSLVAGAGEEGGRLHVGLTNEIARTGKQAIYVDFEKLSARAKRAQLVSQLLPIKPSEPYRISIWGRIDRKRPITLDERRPHLMLEVEYFEADQETQTGEAPFRVQMIPGSIIPGSASRILFVSSRWTEYYTEVKAPESAVFMKVAWSWESGKGEGETDGIAYWDDASIAGPRGSAPLELPDDAPVDTITKPTVPPTKAEK